MGFLTSIDPLTVLGLIGPAIVVVTLILIYFPHRGLALLSLIEFVLAILAAGCICPTVLEAMFLTLLYCGASITYYKDADWFRTFSSTLLFGVYVYIFVEALSIAERPLYALGFLVPAIAWRTLITYWRPM